MTRLRRRLVIGSAWLAISAVMGSCAHNSQPSPALRGTLWRLEDLGGSGVLDDAEATLDFAEEGRFAGLGSCNRFVGTVEIDGDSIRFRALGWTRMACAEAVMNQEGKYLKALGAVERYAIEGTKLLLYSKGPLRFARAS